MTRVLVLVAIALFVAYLLTEVLARLRRRLGELLGPAQASGAGGELVACGACGVHVLRSRALAGASKARAMAPGGAGASGFYCSEACRSRARSAT